MSLRKTSMFYGEDDDDDDNIKEGSSGSEDEVEREMGNISPRASKIDFAKTFANILPPGFSLGDGRASAGRDAGAKSPVADSLNHDESGALGDGNEGQDGATNDSCARSLELLESKENKKTRERYSLCLSGVESPRRASIQAPDLFANEIDTPHTPLKKHSNAFLNTYTKVLMTLTQRLASVRESVVKDELRANLMTTKTLFVELTRRVRNLHLFLAALQIVLDGRGTLPEYDEEDYEIMLEEAIDNGKFATESLSDVASYLRPRGKVDAAYQSIGKSLYAAKASGKDLGTLKITETSFTNIDVAATACVQSMDDILQKMRQRSSQFAATGQTIIAAMRWKRKAGVTRNKA